MVTGVYRDVGSRPSWRLPRLSCLLVVVAVSTVLPSTRGDCAAVHPKCYCVDTGYSYSIFCKDMGHISQVPPFAASNRSYNKLEITRGQTGTTLLTLQRGAFAGITVREIKLVSIGLTAIKSWAFYGVGALHELYISGNQLTEIADNAFNGLNELTQFYLVGCNLNTVNATWLSQMPELVFLSFSSNQLETIPNGTFNGLDKLQTLYLSYNRLTRVRATWWNHLPALQTLVLGNNEIESIEEGAFDDFTHLGRLTIRNNRLKTLNADLIQNMPHLFVLYIIGNPFVCDCQLAWVRDRAVNILRGDPLCATPLSVKGMSVVDYNISMCNTPTTTTKTIITTAAAEATSTGNRANEDTTDEPSIHVTTVGEVLTTNPHVSTIGEVSTTTSTNDVRKENDGDLYYLMTIAMGTLSIALLSGISIYVIRKRCVKCRSAVGENDAYYHIRREEIDLIPPEYDTISWPAPGLETIRKP